LEKEEKKTKANDDAKGRKKKKKQLKMDLLKKYPPRMPLECQS